MEEYANGSQHDNDTLKVTQLERESSDDAPSHYYRLLVEANDVNRLKNPDFWSDGIGCRQYYRSKRSTT